MRTRSKISNKTNSNWIIRKVLFLGILGILAISSVLVTVETATSGVEVASLRKTESLLRMEERGLEGDLAKQLSVNDLDGKSGGLGYVKPSAMIYVSGSQEAVAKLP